jgi:hypothetical protein
LGTNFLLFFNTIGQNREIRPRWVLLEQISVCACAHKHDQPMFYAVVKFVRQQKVPADMALPVPFPFAAQRMIQLFRSKRAIVGDEQQHGLLEPVHVIAAGSGQAFPILLE